MQRIELKPKIATGAFAAICLITQSNVVSAETNREPWRPPLFETSSPLRVTIEAPWREIVRNRASRPVEAARVTFVDSEGLTHAIEAKVRTRGNSRLAHCRFPPLRVDYSRRRIEGTLFEGQRRLKIVTLCKDSARYRGYQRLEFQLYRAFAALTDRSFGVRWIEIDYVDTDNNGKTRSSTAFFIEDIRSVARRHDSERYAEARIKADQLVPEDAALVALYQYMIGNTDWSLRIAPQGDDRCCHNMRLIGNDESRWSPVPYDFDQSGLIDAEYALPSPVLGIRSVRSRVYRGLCAHNAGLETAAQRIRDRRDAIMQAFQDEALSRRNRARSASYLDDFFATLEDPDRFEAELLSACR